LDKTKDDRKSPTLFCMASAKCLARLDTKIMGLSNLLIIWKPSVVQFLIVAMLAVLSVGTVWFPSRAHADSSTIGPLAPSSSGPLIGTYPLFRSDTPITTDTG